MSHPFLTQFSGRIGFSLIIATISVCSVTCFGQTDIPFHSCTINAGGGWSSLAGQQSQDFYTSWHNFQAGVGFAVSGRPKPAHNWSALLTFNFLFSEHDVNDTALQEAKNLNPTNVALLAAGKGKGNYYALTFDPTFRFPLRSRLTGYGLAGFGWLRRDLHFTGVSTQGALLQPGFPSVFGRGGDSGAFDFGGGLNVRVAGGMMVYVEGRFLHGLAVNHTTSLAPVSLGVRW
jgi:hypothetical protein